jgi:O-antigen/teichoic acid export membrane protein
MKFVLSLSSRWRSWLTPSRYLTLTNALSAGIGFLVSVYVARILGPDKLGVVAVISGINSSIAAFIDVRFNDVAAKAFYQADDMIPAQIDAYRAGVLWLAVLATGLLAVVLALVSALVGNLFVPSFTEAPVAGWWLPADALTIAFQTAAGTVMFLLRFSGAFYVIGTWRLLLQVVSGGLTILILILTPTMGALFVARMASGLSTLLLASAVFWVLWTRRVGLPLLRPDWRRARSVYRTSLSMVFYGNLLSYAKLLQRNADVLLVAYFATDRETGIYKLARTFIDQGLGILQEALYQVNYPSFLDAFARRAQMEYRRLAGRLLTTSSLVTLSLLLGEALLLSPFVRLAFGLAYAGAEGPMMILTATFVFIVGFHPWLWALFVGSGRLFGYTAAAFAGVGVQYAVMLGLFRFASPSALTAMIGMFAYYVALVPIAYGLARHRWGEFVLWGPKVPSETTSERIR